MRFFTPIFFIKQLLLGTRKRFQGIVGMRDGWRRRWDDMMGEGDKRWVVWEGMVGKWVGMRRWDDMTGECDKRVGGVGGYGGKVGWDEEMG